MSVFDPLPESALESRVAALEAVAATLAATIAANAAAAAAATADVASARTTGDGGLHDALAAEEAARELEDQRTRDLIGQAVGGGGGAAIDDAATAIDKTWSSSKVSGLLAAKQSAAQVATAITAAIDALVAGAPGALNTLNELAAALANDPNFASSVVTLLAGKQGLSDRLTFLAGASAATAPAMRTLLGLGNVDNTSDANKPVSTATLAAITAAIDALVAGAPGALNTLDELAAALNDDASFAAAVTTALGGKQSLSDRLTFLAGASAATAPAMRNLLGLGNVDNTSDANKPVSTAAQAALDALSDSTTLALSRKAGLSAYSSLTSFGQIWDLATYDAAFTRTEGGCSDGTYVYWVSHPSKKLMRQSIADPTSVTVLDLAGTSLGPATISIASPGVVTRAGHGRSANDPVCLVTTGALPGGYTNGTVHYVRNPTADTFELSTTSGGASINTTGGQSGVHTLYSQPNVGLSFPLGASTDGRYVYVSGHVGTTTTDSPKGNCIMARVDIQNFTPSGVTLLDVATNLPDGFNSCGIGCLLEGRYGYSLLLDNTAPAAGNTTWLARFDTMNFTTGGVTQLTLPAQVAPNRTLLVALVSDGIYVYVMTYTWDGNIAHPYDVIIHRVLISTFTLVDSTAFGSASLLTAPSTAMFFDGRYIWTSPSIGNPFRRIDTLNWPAAEIGPDLAAIDATLTGFGNGTFAFARGRFGYFGPNKNSKLLRLDTQRFGAYAVCDLANTDATAATRAYATMVPTRNHIWLAAGNLNQSKVMRLQMDF